MRNLTHFNLLEYNTFGIDAYCKRFIEFDTEEELKDVLSSLTASDRPLLLLGGGSNLLLTGDYPGTVLHSRIKGKDVSFEGDDVLIRCGSGENWDDLVAHCVAHGWHGAENLSLIPGEVGASAVQNIGAYGMEVKDLIVSVEALEVSTGRKITFLNHECAYAYRQSKFKNEWKDRFVITYVTYCLSRHFRPHLDYGNIRVSLKSKGIDMPTPQQLRDVVIEIREAKLPDPKVEGNAGSFFMNPIVDESLFERIFAEYPLMPHYILDNRQVKIPAGWLIEQCGWKGKTLGNAGVHAKQALVLVNKGGATGQEIVTLCRRIQEDVERKFGIKITPEVNIL